ncbi:hypothetical protein PRIPAC_82070 [Pristionchus pacificus]|uniref:G protein-coupled receptor n=1 Tax=Pristionchus pacificus TaxID=54126 RepID=A0A2A6C2Q1_PRIPA|nr:hypothetical protein PRIPAC_82070 [Pristionchus pacificus]|eukprot:PDM72445.1 G protein-coupled receptor [Pristionchus pacificus]
MFLVNFLNREITDPYFPLYEIIFITEIIVLTFSIMLGITLILPICRHRYHLNIRLRVLFSLIQGFIYPISRIVVIFHQYYGPIDNVEWTHIIICGQIKQEFLGYFTTLISILAYDRLIATKYWAWLHFFSRSMKIQDRFSDTGSTVYFAIVVPIGTALFIATYRYNRAEMVKMKKGAVIHQYSVAKTFQFKENIKMLELFTKIARPIIFVCIPPFAFYPIYGLVPAGIGYDGLRYFSVAMYDLWLSFACVVVIGSLPTYEPELRASKVDHTEAYFAMLGNDLGGTCSQLGVFSGSSTEMFGSIVSEGFYHVGPYRYLLLAFAIVDILVSLVHLALIPAIHMTEFGYIFWGYRFVNESTEVGVWAALLFVILFYQTFVLHAFHFVYRYVMLCNPIWLSWIQNRPWRNWLVIIIIADIIFVGGIFLAIICGFVPIGVSRREFAHVIKEVYDIDLFSQNEPGYLGIVYWTINERGEKEWIRWSLFIICSVCVLFFTTAIIIIICIVKIIREFREHRFANLSAVTKNMQKQLFTKLICQTAVPCLISYAPIGSVYLVPLTGIALGGFETLAVMSSALFPMLDPYIVIFLISGYDWVLHKVWSHNLHYSDTGTRFME